MASSSLERRLPTVPEPVVAVPAVVRRGAPPMPSVPADPRGWADLARLRRQQISHDIRHQLATIMMLAELLSGARDMDDADQNRARLILSEARWLDQLQIAYEEAADDTTAIAIDPIRLDQVAGDVVSAMKLSTFTKISFAAVPVLAWADRLAVWRALRNVLDNAVRAAGPTGEVRVRITADELWAAAQVDDDGPGFTAVPPGRATLGLGIVQDLAAAWGGQLEIRRGALGGCCVRLEIPLATVADDGPEGQ